MAKQVWSNNASTTLSAQIGATDTSMTVDNASDFAALGVDEYEKVTISDGVDVEIVKVVSKNGTLWTIERGQEDTSAKVWVAGSLVEARLTAGTLSSFAQNDQIADSVSDALASYEVPILSIDATGTPGSSTYLRGDGAWVGLDVSSLSITGTPTGSKFLRDDGSWQVPSFGSIDVEDIDATGPTNDTAHLRGDGVWDTSLLTRIASLESQVEDLMAALGDIQSLVAGVDTDVVSALNDHESRIDTLETAV